METGNNGAKSSTEVEVIRVRRFTLYNLGSENSELLSGTSLLFAQELNINSILLELSPEG